MMGQRGGSTVLTEVPEMFGAEGFLMDRCINKEVFVKAEHMINGFKEYFISHNEVVYDNPSPGNKQGGITTLEDKSCGCVQKLSLIHISAPDAHQTYLNGHARVRPGGGGAQRHF